MQLLSVKLIDEYMGEKDAVISIDSIKLVTSNRIGSNIQFIDGTGIVVSDSYNDIIAELLKAKI